MNVEMERAVPPPLALSAAACVLLVEATEEGEAPVN
jgi:hypothetical protein